MRLSSVMPVREKTVLFLTGKDDPLPKHFAAETSDYALTFLFDGGEKPDWVIARVDGQAWLEHVLAGPEHSWFLGADPAEGMRRAVQLIAKWESPGTGSKPN